MIDVAGDLLRVGIWLFLSATIGMIGSWLIQMRQPTHPNEFLRWWLYLGGSLFLVGSGLVALVIAYLKVTDWWTINFGG